MGKASDLDDIDARLIALLQDDASRPVKSIAAKLGISISSVHRRRQALCDKGVIRRFTVDVDPAGIGKAILFLVEVLLERESVTAVQQFKRRIRASPDVVQCYHVTGDRTFVLVVALRDSAEFPRFAEWLCADNSDTLRIRTSLVMDQVKPDLKRR